MNDNMAQMTKSMACMSDDMVAMNSSMERMGYDINTFTKQESIMMPFIPNMR